MPIFWNNLILHLFMFIMAQNLEQKHLKYMRIINWQKLILVGFIFSIVSCYDLENETQFGIGSQEYNLAVPLIDSKITLGKLASDLKGNTSIKIDATGKATVFYNGEVIRRTTAAIFPPFPGLLPIPILDSVWVEEIFDRERYSIKKAVFDGTNIWFTFQNSLPEDINIKLTIPELSKNGQVFTQDFVLKYNNTSPSILVTEKFSVDEWSLTSVNNSITFQYQARTKSGTPIKLDQAQMNFDLIKFSYLEGYLGYHIFPIEGSSVDVGLFNNWLSGSFSFEDPKITISVQNAFGLPVRSRVNKMALTSITGTNVNLESAFINTGIDFAYPSFSEIGTVKTTDFIFDKTNSNLKEIFNEKTKTIAYDIVALINPDRDTTINGYISDGGFFVINVAVEVPLNGSVNNVVLTDTLDIDLADYDEIISAQFKSITSNDFPAEVKVQAYFLDENGQRLDQLFNNDGIILPPASPLPDDTTLPGIDKIDFMEFDDARFANIKRAKKLAIVGAINTIDSENKKSWWIYDNYGIGIKLGAIFKYKQN